VAALKGIAIIIVPATHQAAVCTPAILIHPLIASFPFVVLAPEYATFHAVIAVAALKGFVIAVVSAAY